jgi:hypothetical protein
MVLIKKIRKKLVEHTPHRVTFQGCVRVFDGGWVSKQHIEFFSSQMAPALSQLNSRGKLKWKWRGVAKRVKCTCSRHDFAKLQFAGLKESEVTLLGRAHKTKHHK